MPEPSDWERLIDRVFGRPGLWAFLCLGLAVICGALLGVDRLDPTWLAATPTFRPYALVGLIAGIVGAIWLGTLHWKAQPVVPREADPIPDFKTPRLRKPTQLEREMEEVARLRAEPERPLLDPIPMPQIITSTDDLSAPSPGTPRARFEAAAKAAEEQRKLEVVAKVAQESRPKVQYNIKLPQDRAQMRADAEAEAAQTPADASIWAKDLGETRVVMPETNLLPGSQRLDALLPRSRDYLRYIKAKALTHIQARSTELFFRDLVEKGFLVQIKQTPAGIGTYTLTLAATEAFILLNPDIVVPDGTVPPWDKP